MITIAIAVWLWRTEERGWLRWLAVGAVILIFVQAIVGGLRVLLEKHQVEMLETSVGRLFAMLHACLAQIFVCTLAAIAAACSRPWIEQSTAQKHSDTLAVRRVGILCCILLLTQLGIAAVMRHSYAGLAIPTFPYSTADGDWLPQAWNFRVAIHFAHRVMAAAISITIIWFVWTLLRERDVSRNLKTMGAALIILLGLQVYLGACVVWSGRNPELTTAHVIVGACFLATTFLITWYLHRDAIETGELASAKTVQRRASPTSELSHA